MHSTSSRISISRDSDSRNPARLFRHARPSKILISGHFEPFAAGFTAIPTGWWFATCSRNPPIEPELHVPFFRTGITVPVLTGGFRLIPAPVTQPSDKASYG
ncbi:hypothetical protein V6N11_011668 [Hibiscus sabdariffa]|uniref:Uncharacterized protein n=1 Tax=Hibiscus sabdariffa TaxID=183260 RepID=A0ABR2S973_9ROSI